MEWTQDGQLAPIVFECFPAKNRAKRRALPITRILGGCELPLPLLDQLQGLHRRQGILFGSTDLLDKWMGLVPKQG